MRFDTINVGIFECDRATLAEKSQPALFRAQFVWPPDEFLEFMGRWIVRATER
jgi:hypothetical protein